MTLGYVLVLAAVLATGGWLRGLIDDRAAVAFVLLLLLIAVAEFVDSLVSRDRKVS